MSQYFLNFTLTCLSFIVSLIGLELVLQNVQDLIQGCPYLTHLDLSLSQHLHAFVGGISQVGDIAVP